MKIVIVTEEHCHTYSERMRYVSQIGCSDQDKDDFWELLHEKTAEVTSEDNRIMKIVIVTEEHCHTYSERMRYVSQIGCSDQDKDDFWELLHEKTAEVTSEDNRIVGNI
uniref:Lipoprotein n=1 Tax=Loa loa TaxID=7209 RepID=A0A1I7VBD0_LOALO